MNTIISLMLGICASVIAVPTYELLSALLTHLVSTMKFWRYQHWRKRHRVPIGVITNTDGTIEVIEI